MNLLLPMIYNLIVNLMADQSDQSVLMQKQILKIYHALTQVSFKTYCLINCIKLILIQFI